MNENKTRETLEKQLQLLSERSEGASEEMMCKLTEAMVQVAKLLIF